MFLHVFFELHERPLSFSCPMNIMNKQVLCKTGDKDETDEFPRPSKSQCFLISGINP